MTGMPALQTKHCAYLKHVADEDTNWIEELGRCLHKGRAFRAMHCYAGKCLRVLVLPGSVYLEDGAPPEIFIALEGEACMYYDGTVPLDEFVLLKHGFPMQFSEQFASGLCEMFLRAYCPAKFEAQSSTTKPHGATVLHLTDK